MSRKRPKNKTNRRIRTLDPQKALLLKQVFIGSSLFILLTAVLAGVWYGTRLEAVTIDTVTVSGGDTISHGQVQEIAETLLEKQYFHLIPKRFSYLYPEQKIKKAIKNIDRVATVSMERVGRTALHISFVEHIPYALWCDNKGESCVFTDNIGYAFATAPDLTGGSLFRFYDERGAPTVGAMVTQVYRVARISDLVDALEGEIGWGTQRVTLNTDDRITVQTTEAAELYIHLDQPAEHTMHYLRTLLQTDGYEHLVDQSFAYIDLRFGNRLFVNQTLVAGAATSTDIVDGDLPPASVETEPVFSTVVSETSTHSTDSEVLLQEDVDVTRSNVVESADPLSESIAESTDIVDSE